MALFWSESQFVKTQKKKRAQRRANDLEDQDAS
jgi:hypothetical protein